MVGQRCSFYVHQQQYIPTAHRIRRAASVILLFFIFINFSVRFHRPTKIEKPHDEIIIPTLTPGARLEFERNFFCPGGRRRSVIFSSWFISTSVTQLPRFLFWYQLDCVLRPMAIADITRRVYRRTGFVYRRSGKLSPKWPFLGYNWVPRKKR